jgi:hypothetical protein
VVPSSPTVCYGALDPPGRGTFHFENLIMPPLTKTCPKMVLSHKGRSLYVKDTFEKKFVGAGRDSAGARSHRFFGNTLVKAGHLMRPSAQRKSRAVMRTRSVSPPILSSRAWLQRTNLWRG